MQPQSARNRPKLVSRRLPICYLPVNSCFSIHKENKTVATAVPIDAMSAMIAIFFSRESWLNTIIYPDKTNRSTVMRVNKLFLGALFAERRPVNDCYHESCYEE